MKTTWTSLGAVLAGWVACGSQAWAQGLAAAPEMDAGGALTAMALLTGVVAVIAERHRKKGG